MTVPPRTRADYERSLASGHTESLPAFELRACRRKPPPIDVAAMAQKVADLAAHKPAPAP